MYLKSSLSVGEMKKPFFLQKSILYVPVEVKVSYPYEFWLWHKIKDLLESLNTYGYVFRDIPSWRHVESFLMHNLILFDLKSSRIVFWTSSLEQTGEDFVGILLQNGSWTHMLRKFQDNVCANYLWSQFYEEKSIKYFLVHIEGFFLVNDMQTPTFKKCSPTLVQKVAQWDMVVQNS